MTTDTVLDAPAPPAHPWLNRAVYPFAPHYLNLPMGRMHYVDEGQGRPVVFVHGTPTWSFLYRHLISALSPHYRCIAPDHIGFGLSDKPEHWSYRLTAHAANLEQLIEHLGLHDITLVVHDFGGPIGLSYALQHPEQVRSLVIMNTWLWSLADKPSVVWGSKMLGSAFGRWLNRRTNFDPRVIIPAVIAKKSILTPELRAQYVKPFGSPAERNGPMAFAHELAAASDWYDACWQQRERIQDKPMLLLWGMQDPLLTPSLLERWQTAFPAAEVVRYPDTGHMVAEEQGAALAAPVQTFLARG